MSIVQTWSFISFDEGRRIALLSFLQLFTRFCRSILGDGDAAEDVLRVDGELDIDVDWLLGILPACPHAECTNVIIIKFRITQSVSGL